MPFIDNPNWLCGLKFCFFRFNDSASYLHYLIWANMACLLFQWQNIQVFGSSFIYNLTLLFMGKITFKCLGSFRMNYQQTSKDNNIDAFNTHFCMNELFIVWQKFHNYLVLFVPLSSINNRGTNDVINKHVSVYEMLLLSVYGNKFILLQLLSVGGPLLCLERLTLRFVDLVFFSVMLFVTSSVQTFSRIRWIVNAHKHARDSSCMRQKESGV